jgi:hypothetical protein
VRFVTRRDSDSSPRLLAHVTQHYATSLHSLRKANASRAALEIWRLLCFNTAISDLRNCTAAHLRTLLLRRVRNLLGVAVFRFDIHDRRFGNVADEDCLLARNVGLRRNRDRLRIGVLRLARQRIS